MMAHSNASFTAAVASDSLLGGVPSGMDDGASATNDGAFFFFFFFLFFFVRLVVPCPLSFFSSIVLCLVGIERRRCDDDDGNAVNE